MKHLMTIEEARENLRLDSDDNDIIIKPLLAAMPDYLEIKTGQKWGKADPKDVDPLAQTAAKFILQLWYNPMSTDTDRLNRTIDSLLYALTVKDNG